MIIMIIIIIIIMGFPCAFIQMRQTNVKASSWKSFSFTQCVHPIINIICGGFKIPTQEEF